MAVRLGNDVAAILYHGDAACFVSCKRHDQLAIAKVVY
jgi:hypothetical protein